MLLLQGVGRYRTGRSSSESCAPDFAISVEQDDAYMQPHMPHSTSSVSPAASGATASTKNSKHITKTVKEDFASGTGRTWECSKCTLKNSVTARKCAACDADRPEKKIMQKEGRTLSGSWSCPDCTLINSDAAIQCTACERKKGSVSAPGKPPLIVEGNSGP